MLITRVLIGLSLLLSPQYKDKHPPKWADMNDVYQVTINLECIRDDMDITNSERGWLLGYLRENFNEYKNYPPISDVKFLPSKEATEKMDDYLTSLYNTLIVRQSILTRNKDELQDIIEEVLRIQEINKLLVAANTEFYSIPTRRKYLNDLREKIGPANYYRGIIPNIVERLHIND